MSSRDPLPDAVVETGAVLQRSPEMARLSDRSMSAQIAHIRDTAEWLRKRAARMPAGPYGMHSAWTGYETMLSKVTSRHGVVAEVRDRHPGPMRGGYVTDFLSYMTPEFAVAVADWLDQVARLYHEGSTGPLDVPAALAVAVAYQPMPTAVAGGESDG